MFWCFVARVWCATKRFLKLLFFTKKTLKYSILVGKIGRWEQAIEPASGDV